MERDNMMHGARSALNANPEIRAWAENYLKEKARKDNTLMSEEEFGKYWRYHKPELVHEGAVEAVMAYREREK